MKLTDRYKRDFGSDYDSFEYQVSYEKAGWTNYTFCCVFSMKNYNQFSVVTVDTIDKGFVKIPESLLALKNSDKNVSYNVFTLIKEKENFANIPHTRNVYIYCENSEIDKNVIVQYFLKYNLRAIIRDNKYFEMQRADFFISHDSRDKDKVARPLYDELTERGFKVWYDEYSLKIGDSLTESIERGISESKYGIIILSKNFLSNEKWAKNELQSLKTKQIIKNQNIILPVWHQIEEKDLEGNYWLLDKLGGNTNKGIGQLADMLVKGINTT